MKKIVEITEIKKCDDCPFVKIYSDTINYEDYTLKAWCTHPQIDTNYRELGIEKGERKYIKREFYKHQDIKIPIWCPLEDV